MAPNTTYTICSIPDGFKPSKNIQVSVTINNDNSMCVGFGQLFTYSNDATVYLSTGNFTLGSLFGYANAVGLYW